VVGFKVAVVLSIVAFVAPAPAVVLRAYPVKLSASDRAELEALACPNKSASGQVRIDASRYDKAPNAKVYVTVDCQGRAKQYRFCEGTSGEWTCYRESRK
jgi:hypothetical protein